ncbi:MAG: 50S ribosomal protein L25/general stress protein Ctc [Bacillota bacterium]|jgi:large subunit ribosomal protein L25|nr:50S ribosomal protein L25/general stress protein Ctc [Bacillota bacterium]HHU29301.1 50S ribosomal protein L25/general stress protein Ctc [Bacillota bacterium]
MERMQVQAQPRFTTTKGQLKELRRKGLVPGVLYGKKEELVSLTVDSRDINAILNSPTGLNTIIDLNLDGTKTTVMIKELMRDALQPDLFIHTDFIRISLQDKLEVQVPIVLTGEAQGVKKGGILQILLREVTLRCLPTNIPEKIEADVSELQMGDTLTVADLVLPSDTEIVSEPDEVVASIVAPRVEEEPEEAAEEGEGAEVEETAAPEAEEESAEAEE